MSTCMPAKGRRQPACTQTGALTSMQACRHAGMHAPACMHKFENPRTHACPHQCIMDLKDAHDHSALFFFPSFPFAPVDSSSVPTWRGSASRPMSSKRQQQQQQQRQRQRQLRS
eukprot:350354-Chlamydomonas_euryale.AAC.5